ncbi:hypothetical protein RB195_009568 [Necator americanus]|uniref:Integrase catalytic domain-containing protein n=1 Tax=Necator americanus TaxID=51031 RepID=A0ABR1CX93_NECAM
MQRRRGQTPLPRPSAGYSSTTSSSHDTREHLVWQWRGNKTFGKDAGARTSNTSEITNAETLLIMEHHRESESTLKRLPLDSTTTRPDSIQVFTPQSPLSALHILFPLSKPPSPEYFGTVQYVEEPKDTLTAILKCLVSLRNESTALDSSRRGTPDLIISDNATTFRSTNDSLQNTINNRKAVEKISAQFAKRRVEWRFITPLSPWKGGFYERVVGLFKSVFKKAIKHTLLPLSQFQTLVAEIKVVLNSRLLLSISGTSSSPHVLRPIDFVSPQVELQLPSPNRNSLYITSNRLSEWYKETSAVLNNFWDIWYKDFLSAISARHQHRIHQGRSGPLIPSVEHVVLIADKNVPRGQWPLAIITTIHRSKTNTRRPATVRIANGHELTDQSTKSVGDFCKGRPTTEEDYNLHGSNHHEQPNGYDLHSVRSEHEHFLLSVFCALCFLV